MSLPRVLCSGASTALSVQWLGYWLDNWGIVVPLSTRSKLFLWAKQPPTQTGIRGPFLGVKWQRHEADHPPPISAEIKKAWSYTPTLAFMALCLVPYTTSTFRVLSNLFSATYSFCWLPVSTSSILTLFFISALSSSSFSSSDPHIHSESVGS
jgi:hypothetical protein